MIEQSESPEPDAKEQVPATQFKVPRFRWRSLGRLTLKELRETLRDRRTVVTLVLMPLLVYPLLSLAFHRFLLLYFEPGETIVHIGFVSEDDVEVFQTLVLRGHRLLSSEGDDEPSDVPAPLTAPGMETGSADSAKSSSDSLPEFLMCSDADEMEAMLLAGRIDVGVQVIKSDGISVFELTYEDTSPNSLRGLKFIVDRFRIVNERFGRRLARQFLRQPGLPAEFERKRISSDSPGGVSLAIVLPLILVLMTITGAVYPAIDLTAGERERGTLEALIAAPVPRLALLSAKYFAVVIVAQLTAIMNLIAMAVTVIASGLAQYLFPGGEFSLLVVIQIMGLLFLFAGFFSAVLLVITSVARSFKEAQAYLIPIMMLSIAPGIVSLVGDLELAQWYAVPLLNMVLFARDLIEGNADPMSGVKAILTTVVYTMAAVAVAARLFGADAVLYGAQSSWKDLFRRPAQPIDGPSLSGSVGALAVMFPIFFLIGGLMRQLELSKLQEFTLAGIFSVLLFALFPVVLCLAFRLRISKTLPLRFPHWTGLAAGVLWGLTAWMFAHEILIASQYLGIVMLDEEKLAERLAGIEQELVKWRELPLIVILLSQAIAPAVCEEIFFRGFLYRGLERSTSILSALLWSSLLFGAFHVVSGPVLTLERFLPSTLLGLLLGTLRLRSGSLVPGMVMHALSNGLILSIAYYSDKLQAAGWGVKDADHLPMTWLLVATLAVGAGGAILFGKLAPRATMDPNKIE
ncbi:MAG: ABC transporter permease subunit [Pirellulaceae bacterium]